MYLFFIYLSLSGLFRPLAASSTAVLVQLTPLLGALLGIVGTLILVVVFVAVCLKMNRKVSMSMCGGPSWLSPLPGWRDGVS